MLAQVDKDGEGKGTLRGDAHSDSLVRGSFIELPTVTDPYVGP